MYRVELPVSAGGSCVLCWDSEQLLTFHHPRCQTILFVPPAMKILWVRPWKPRTIASTSITLYALMEDVASISSNFPSIQSIKNFKSTTEYFKFIQRGMLVLPDALPRKVLLKMLQVWRLHYGGKCSRGQIPKHVFHFQPCVKAMDQSWHPEHFQCYGCLVVFSDNMSYREKVLWPLTRMGWCPRTGWGQRLMNLCVGNMPR